MGVLFGAYFLPCLSFSGGPFRLKPQTFVWFFFRMADGARMRPCANPECNLVAHNDPETQNIHNGYCCEKCWGRHTCQPWAQKRPYHYKNCSGTLARDGEKPTLRGGGEKPTLRGKREKPSLREKPTMRGGGGGFIPRRSRYTSPRCSRTHGSSSTSRTTGPPPGR